MAWARPQIKTAQPKVIPPGIIGPGAPVSRNPGRVGQPYRDGWDIQRAYDEGYKRVTWVMRCIDVIAGNQARLPAILRKGNFHNGEIMIPDNNDLLRVMNVRANQGENAFTFRKRISSQLLMSTRGVFIEKVMSNSGKLLALNLLPPRYTYPIPDPKTFVSGYMVMLPTGERVTLPPEKVVWIRNPHPLDPYLSVTPMESAGIAIDIENLAKQYNRTFLQKDGRPGLLLVVRGEVNPDDKSELEARFSGGPNQAGRTSVVGADDGIDAIDMAASPRDASYIEMRNLTQAEILAAFGVPTTALGHAAGRTFSNAGEEMRTFWEETMLPHLEIVARGLDELDDSNYLDFDTSEVPVLVLLRQETARFNLAEAAGGVISANEYRIATGRKECDSDLADELLYNPNTTPIANTKKKFVPPPPVDPNALGTPGQVAGAQAAAAAGTATSSSPSTTDAPPSDTQASASSELLHWDEISQNILNDLK